MAISDAIKNKLTNELNYSAQLADLGQVIQDLQNSSTGSSALLTATAGVATASKAAILGANKNLDVLAVADLKLGAGAGTSVTSTAAELNILHNVSPTLTYSELNLLDGVTKTTGEINLMLAGLAGNYKLARGVATIGTASDTIVTGLATVVAATVSLVSAPTTTHMWSTVSVGDQAGSPAAGSIIISSYKPTAVDNVTPVNADTVFSNVYWIAIGT